MKRAKVKIINLYIFCALLITGFLAGCATPFGTGLTPEGQKVYLGRVPIENTPEYEEYLASKGTEVAKQTYIFQRLKSAKHLEFGYDGSWYNYLEAYRGGMWLIRNRYQKGQDAREFIYKNVECEKGSSTGKPPLVKYPDGSIHIGAYVLYNELDLLEETVSRGAG